MSVNAPPAPAPEVLTAAEAAEILRLSPAHVRRLAGLGKIPGAVLIGGSWRFSRETLTGLFKASPA